MISKPLLLHQRQYGLEGQPCIVGNGLAQFQRDPEFGCKNDRRVYVKCNNPINAGDNRFRESSAGPGTIIVEFSEPFDEQKRFGSAIVRLAVGRAALSIFIAMLRRIFTDYESLLRINDNSCC